MIGQRRLWIRQKLMNLSRIAFAVIEVSLLSLSSGKICQQQKKEQGCHFGRQNWKARLPNLSLMQTVATEHFIPSV